MTVDDRALNASLQRVLLPPGLPRVDGWAMATLYEPAGQGVLVGGDFYDWFTLPNGNLVFLLGDVSGKGPIAGALGMSIRKALKGIAWATGDPVASLPMVEQALSDEFGESFATVCMIEVTPGSGRLTVTSVGHPAPWVRSRGAAAVEVETPTNAVLGPGLNGPQWRSSQLELAPGDSLLLFSDGLSDARLADGSLYGEGVLAGVRQHPA